MKPKRSAGVLALPLLLTAACSDLATEPDRYPAELRVSPDTVTVSAGDPLAFDVEVFDQDGERFERIPSWSPPLWQVGNPGLATLQAGVGTALAAGSTSAVAELAGLMAAAVIQVNPLELGVTVPAVYLTQAVQRPDGTVPLVAGREALLRVFVNGSEPNFFRPRVRAVFLNGGSEVHTAFLEIENNGIPRVFDQGDLELSFDAVIPAEVIAPGLTYYIEVDPDGIVPASSGSTLRFPEAGASPVDVREVPPFRLRMVPVNHERVSSLSQSMAEDMTVLAADIFPFGEFDLDVRTPYTTSVDLGTSDGWFDLIYEIVALRLDDGSDRYYYGGFKRQTFGGILGLGFVGYPVSIGDEAMPGTIAHEIGHNLGLRHAPCGEPAGVDAAYPYGSAGTGHYGYDRSSGEIQDPGERRDLMSYCDPIWISDYNYEKVLAYRDTSVFDAAFEESATGSVKAPSERTLLVAGGVADGRPTLRPALLWSGPERLPTGSDSEHRLEGLDGAGTVLFSVPVDPRPLTHLDASTFVVSLPESLARPDVLEVLRLTGPEGVAEQRRGGPATGRPEVAVQRPAAGFGGSVAPRARWDAARYPLAVVRDRATGRIIAMDRDGELRLPRSHPGLVEVELSDGVSSRAARVVVR